MRTAFLTTLALTLITTSVAFGSSHTMSASEIENFRNGFKHALTQQAVKSCERHYMNKINSVQSTNLRNCEDEASFTLSVRIDSNLWSGLHSVINDGLVEIRLIQVQTKETLQSPHERVAQEMIVRLNAEQTKIIEVSLRTAVHIRGENTNTGTITNPVFKPSQDIYEDLMLATY